MVEQQIEQDTIKLLRECDAGIKMGVKSIEDVLDYVHSDRLKACLVECKREHEKLREEIDEALTRFHDDGKEPNPMAKGMSWLKTNMMLAVDEPDEKIADLITDGCDMGTKSLNKYLNQYEAASEDAKDITKRLIKREDDVAAEIRCYL